MKPLIIGAAIAIGSLALTQQSQAQLRVGVNINIGDQPSWRAPGYNYVEYYYLPDIESYYYVPTRQFIYMSGGRWIYSSSVPQRYRGYNLNTGYKVVINRPNAYNYFEEDRRKYGRRHDRNNWNRYDNGRHRGWNKRGRH